MLGCPITRTPTAVFQKREIRVFAARSVSEYDAVTCRGSGVMLATRPVGDVVPDAFPQPPPVVLKAARYGFVLFVGLALGVAVALPGFVERAGLRALAAAVLLLAHCHGQEIVRKIIVAAVAAVLPRT